MIITTLYYKDKNIENQTFCQSMESETLYDASKNAIKLLNKLKGTNAYFKKIEIYATDSYNLPLI